MNKILFSFGLFLLFAFACKHKPSSESTLADNSNENLSYVLISKDNGGHIQEWMQGLDPLIHSKECYGLTADSLNFYLNRAIGLIIGGGEDVNPALYNKPEYVELCGKFDHYRDSLELKMIRYADENNLPLLGICRGQQIINVAFGGTLIPDIPSYVNNPLAHNSRSDSAHLLLPVEGLWTSEFQFLDSIWVNSRHHQSIDQLAQGFKIAAYSPDSVVEAIVRMDQSGHPFTMGVQFHPENLRDSLSNHFGRMFLETIQ